MSFYLQVSRYRVIGSGIDSVPEAGRWETLRAQAKQELDEVRNIPYNKIPFQEEFCHEYDS